MITSSGGEGFTLKGMGGEVKSTVGSGYPYPEPKNRGSFVFNVEIVFYYALLCCPPADNTCGLRVGVEFISTRFWRGYWGEDPAKSGISPLRVIIPCRLL